MSELGTKLRNARVEKGYTLNTLQQMTKIQKKYLVAIEEGQYSEMPGTFYVRAFVKQYADMVGLNGDVLLEEYKDELSVSENEEEEVIDLSDEELPSRLNMKRNTTNDQTTLELLVSYLPLIGLIAIIVAIILTLVIAINRIGKIEDQAEPVSSNNSAVVSTIEPNESGTKKVSNSPKNETLTENQIKVGKNVLTDISVEGGEQTFKIEGDFKDYKFEVKGLGYDWVGFYEDEVMVQDQTVSETNNVTYQVKDGVTSFRIQVGYPQGAEIYVNGVKIEYGTSVYPNSVVFTVSDSNTETQSTSQEITSSVSENQNYTDPNQLTSEGETVNGQ